MTSFTGTTAVASATNDMQMFKQAMKEVSAHPECLCSRQFERQRWNPYSMEGESTCVISGDNFAIIASDTRMTQNDINILASAAEKIHVLNDSIVLTTPSFYGDVLQLKKVLQSRLHKYRFDYRSDMSMDLRASSITTPKQFSTESTSTERELSSVTILSVESSDWDTLQLEPPSQ